MEGRPMHAILKEGQDGKLLTKSLQNYQTTDFSLLGERILTVHNILGLRPGVLCCCCSCPKKIDPTLKPIKK